MPLNLNALIAASDAVAERLGDLFDYRLQIEPMFTDWYVIDGIETYRPIGREGAGGVFVELPDRRILYISSEGAAGIIACDFQAFIQLIVAHPYWKDILSFSGNGDLAQMRRAALAMERFTIDDIDDDLDEAREFVIAELALDEPDDAVAALHQAVSTSEVIVRARSDGNPATGLFRASTIDKSPVLRDLAD
jgi:hypothetical protein